MSGPKRSRLLVVNCLVSGTVTPDRSAESTMALSQYPRLNIGDGSRESDRRGLNMGIKHVEAMIVSWQSAAGRRHCQWCLTLASGAISHGDGALSLRFNCARLSRDAIQFEQQLRLVTQLSPTSAAGRVTRTGEDSYWARSVLRQ